MQRFTASVSAQTCHHQERLSSTRRSSLIQNPPQSPPSDRALRRDGTQCSQTATDDIQKIKSILGDIKDPVIKAALEKIIKNPAATNATGSSVAEARPLRKRTEEFCVVGPQPPSLETQQHVEHVIYHEVTALTDVDLLFAGLSYAGFDRGRQNNVCINTNLKRFKAFFGVPPSTLVPMFSDLTDKYPKVRRKDLLMTMNWFTLYEVREVLAGRWGHCEDYIGPKVKECGAMIQSLMPLKIRFEFCDNHRKFLASYDTVNFCVEEFRLDPSAKWFDHKSHSSGLVSYYFMNMTL